MNRKKKGGAAFYMSREKKDGAEVYMNREKKERTIGFVYAVWTGILWGASSPVAQYLFEAKGIDSSWLTPYRLLVSGCLLLICAAARKQDILGVWKEKADAFRLVIFGIVGMMGMQYSFFAAVQATDAGTATFFQYLNPAMLIMFYAVRGRKLPDKRELTAVFCAVSGIFLIATHGNLNSLNVSAEGIALGLLTALTTCFYAVLPIPLLGKYPSESVCAWAMIIGGITLTAVRRPWQMAVTIDRAVVTAFLAIVILGTILPFCFYLWALTRIGAVYTGLMTSVEPVTATVLAAVFLGTAFEAIDVAGFVLVLSTGFILNTGKGRD